MTIVMQMQWAGFSNEDYDRVMAVLRLDVDPPAGGVLHVAGADGGTFRVTDVWESEAAWNTFRENRLLPAFQEAGVTDKGQPDVRVYEAHNVFAEGTEA